MAKDSAPAVTTGLIFIALILVMIGSFGAVAKRISGPGVYTYELTGSSRPAKLTQARARTDFDLRPE